MRRAAEHPTRLPVNSLAMNHEQHVLEPHGQHALSRHHFVPSFPALPVSLPVAVIQGYPSSSFPASAAGPFVSYSFSQDTALELSCMLPSVAHGPADAHHNTSGKAGPSMQRTALQGITSPLSPIPLPLASQAPSGKELQALEKRTSKAKATHIPTSSALKGPSFSVIPQSTFTSTPKETMVAFNGEIGSFPKHLKSTARTEADPYANAFLRDQLGNEKWDIFSSRLFERRYGPQSPTRKKGRHTGGDDGAGKASNATALDFLVKVEVVKEVLRSYVPHPYNPLKYLTHPYEASPSGYVTLTRSTVLALSGWSNTQFSYWARRAEAISVLADHDPRLRTLACALQCRLHPPTCPPPIPSTHTQHTSNYASTSTSPPATISHPSTDADPGAEHELCSAECITGKGLDALIDAVKARTGASQFLRGKHSSLDPFGTAPDTDTDPTVLGGDGGGTPHTQEVYMPTFQAVMYRHSPPPACAPSVAGGPDLVESGHPLSIGESKRTRLRPGSDGGRDLEDFVRMWNGGGDGSERRGACIETAVPGVRRDAGTRRFVQQEGSVTRRELFPVSDSRSEGRVRLMKRSESTVAAVGDVPKKRTRGSLS